MIDFLLKSTISLTIFLSFYHLVLEREKMHQFNRFYLLFSIVISLIIPFLTFEIIQITTVVQYIESVKPETLPKTFIENPIKESATLLQEKTNYIPYILWTVYTTIGLVLLIRFSRNCFKLILKSKLNTIVKYKNADIVLINEETLPHTFLNSIFINHDDYKNRTIEDELYTHELVHVTQKHTLDILFIEFLKCVFWFNPLFYLYKKAIQLNHEFLADEKVVTSYNNVTFYQNLLLQKSSTIQTIYLASNLNYLVTKKRLIMMTKSTSKKIALIKKVAIVPILAGLIYFFCIKVVAQEKIVNVNSETNKSEITDKDKIRDSYYSGVYVKIIDEKAKRKEVTLYENLSLNDKRKYLDYIPEINIEKEIPELLFERLKTKNWKIGINNKLIKKEELKNYKITDFSYYSYSCVDKSERTDNFPLEYQYTLYTKDYFDTNMKDAHIHFKSDTIKIVNVSYKTAMKNVVVNKSKSDTIVWYTKGKEGYNLYFNEEKNKKTIVIDAGHGGKDTGTEINGELESKIVESIAKKISLLNANGDIEIILLRGDDSFIELSERVNQINKINPSLLISLHINASKNINENGINAYIYRQNDFYEKSYESAKSLVDKISNDKLAKGEIKDADFYVIKKSKCPAVLLEVGYLTNDNDKTYITSEKGKNEIANRIFAFLKQ